MKIATFNINNVNKRLRNLVAWLENAKPDVVCLQELKATDSEFPLTALERAGYGGVWRGQKSWNGVAILARGCEPVVTHTTLPGEPADTQSRYIEAAVNGVLIGTLYAPNGNPQPGPKFKYKLAWMQRSDRVDPALIEETFEKRPSLGLHERVILVGFRRVNVRICWHDIVIPCQHDWRAEAV